MKAERSRDTVLKEARSIMDWKEAGALERLEKAPLDVCRVISSPVEKWGWEPSLEFRGKLDLIIKNRLDQQSHEAIQIAKKSLAVGMRGHVLGIWILILTIVSIVISLLKK
jgi:hypothetical protein